MAKIAPYCRPAGTGLNSTDSAVARRLSRLLTALGDEINAHCVDGQIAEDVRNFRMDLHGRLQADGWRINGKDGGGWRVLPPKGDA